MLSHKFSFQIPHIHNQGSQKTLQPGFDQHQTYEALTPKTWDRPGLPASPDVCFSGLNEGAPGFQDKCTKPRRRDPPQECESKEFLPLVLLLDLLAIPLNSATTQRSHVKSHETSTVHLLNIPQMPHTLRRFAGFNFWSVDSGCLENT